MGLLDFIKKTELQKINELNESIKQLENTKTQLENKLERYSKIISLENEIEKQKNELEQIKIDLDHYKQNSKIEKERLKDEYKQATKTYEELKNKVKLFESKLDLAEFGLYEPTYNFDKSDDYREKQNEIIERQKELIYLDTAVKCDTNWTVGDDARKGQALIKKYKRLILRAFNGESDSLLAKIKWNNANQIIERLENTFNTINKLGNDFNVYITTSYLHLKKEEIILEYEYQQKVKEEKEQARALQAEIREEEKAKRDFEKAQKEAEKEEALFQKALEKARQQLIGSDEGNREKLKSEIERLEKELAETLSKKERALSMAQQTKKGYVYIISNIGAFGDNVYKIGMTRRLDPYDRVRELGDASVPFQFDVHALIFSDEARTLEYELHKAFSDKKVNMFNYRKEFFRVTLQEIEDKIKELGFDAEFRSEPEAMEYRETEILLRNKTMGSNRIDEIKSDYPTSIFNDDDE